MRCQNIVLDGQDTCANPILGRYQQVVFVRKEDLEYYEVETNINMIRYPALRAIGTHKIKFRLKQGYRGLRFQLTENSSIIQASFSKTSKNGIPFYEHKVSIAIFGVTQEIKWILKQFDLAKDYFAVLQHKSNIIEVFGFEHGFKSDNYEYDDSVNLNLVSSFAEVQPPYVYESDIIGNEIKDFDDNFKVGNDAREPDYNNDFNNDFNNP